MNKKISDFIYEINKEFVDSKRDILIINREIEQILHKNGNVRNYKIYTCKCNKCSDTFKITEGHLKEGRGCPTCHSKKFVEGINDIPTTAPWMIKYFQGGIDEAKLYTRNSNKKIKPKCPDCGMIRDNDITVNKLYQNNGFRCVCSDGISYPEKFVFYLLTKMNIEFNYQVTNTTLPWVNKYRYDFYIPAYSMIIEANGEQHYKGNFITLGGRTKDQENENDARKEKLAYKNGIKYYVRLDCRKSNSEWIRNAIKTSIILDVLNYKEDAIDWTECEKFARNNLVKEICKFKKDNRTMTATDISKIFNIDNCTVSRYLNIGHKYGWCYYSGLTRCVEVFKNDKSIGVYDSAKDVVLNFKNEKFCDESIRRVCREGSKLYKGYGFQYVS